MAKTSRAPVGVSRYDEDIKREAVALAVERGLGVASRELDIPPTTLATWVRASGIEPSATHQTLVLERWRRDRWNLVEKMLIGADHWAGKLTDMESPTNAQRAATTVAILIDKVLTLTGEANQRTEHTTINVGEVAKLLAEVSGRRDASIPAASRVVDEVSPPIHTDPDISAGQS